MDELRAELSGAPSVAGACRTPATVVSPLVFALALLASACGDGALASRSAGAGPERGTRQAAMVPPSLDEGLAIFRKGLPVPAALTDGERSREALVRRFVKAIERSDTSDVRAMLMSRAEFAYLYYPSSPFAERQQASLWWFLNIENSRKGITRAFDRLAGKPLRYRGLSCPRERVPDGDSYTHDHCVVSLQLGSDSVAIRLFGSIIERDGRFKFMGYANDF